MGETDLQARPLPLSERLRQIAEQSGPERISLSELSQQLHSRVWGGLLVILAAINVIPLPPGTNTVLAIPLVLVSAQMALGRASPWFPGRIDRRGITKDELQQLIAKMGPIEARVERIFRPRLGQLTAPAATRAIGLTCMALSVIAGLPILMIHNAPAVAILLFGLALIYRDGVLVILGAIAAVLAVAFDAALVIWGVAVVKYALAWLHR
ncbi:MAG TPA: exopolysaccharide biosynthesis protein [Sphingomicrobium sp.]|nr:exopolysaccharide biosynthesis protein [Sphingomicrobium sp.]